MAEVDGYISETASAAYEAQYPAEGPDHPVGLDKEEEEVDDAEALRRRAEALAERAAAKKRLLSEQEREGLTGQPWELSALMGHAAAAIEALREGSGVVVSVATLYRFRTPNHNCNPNLQP